MRSNVRRTRPNHRQIARHAGATVALAVIALITAAAALAAHPNAGGRFSGFTSASPINGFKAPVTFNVSSNGSTLQNFKYSSFGCFGAGGFRPGIDYYTQPNNIIKVGNVKLSKAGRFSISGAVSTSNSFGDITKTTSTVSGRFTSARTATGSISFSQKVSGKFTSSCGPGVIHFTVKAR